MKTRRIFILILMFVVVICYLTGLGFANITASAAETNFNDSSTLIATDYYYDNDNGNYSTSSNVKHNEWSHFFNLSLVNAGGFKKSGSTYIAKTFLPMALKIDGTENYVSIHNYGKNDGSDGIHNYSYDSNGYVNGHLVEGGLIIIEYYTSSGTVSSIQSESLWVRDLNSPIEIPLTYHSGIMIRVRLCYELWKIQDGKRFYWNITQYSEPFYLKTASTLYEEKVAPAAFYTYIVDDKTNTQSALEKPLYIRGVNKGTSTSPIIQLELQCDYLSPKAVDSKSRIYAGHDDLDFWFTAAKFDWWYTLNYEKSYLEIDGKKSPLFITPEGIQIYKFEALSSTSIRISMHISIQYNYTEYKHVFWCPVVEESDTQEGYINYSFSVPVSYSNVNDGAILFYEDAISGTNYSKVSLVEDGMVRSKNTLGILSLSNINQYTVKVERQENGLWRVAKSSEYTLTKPFSINLYKIVFNCTESIEKYRVTVFDNDGVKNSREFYIITDLENVIKLTLSHEQYNAINNMPWVKELSDHKTSCFFPELVQENIETTEISNGIKVVKTITIGNYQHGNYIGDKHKFVYEFYIGAVAAPRLNSIKFQSAKFHILPESYSVKEGTKVYAFKNYEDARSFLTSILKVNYSKPTSLSQGIKDKENFDKDIEIRIVHNLSQHELVQQANGNIDNIYVATNAQAPLDEQILMFEDDYWGLSKTDAISISFQSSKGIFDYFYTDDKKIEATNIANKLGFNQQIQVTEYFYDGTSLSYIVIIQEGNSPITQNQVEV